MAWFVFFWSIIQFLSYVQGEETEETFRLPTSIIPYKYRIGLVPDIYGGDPRNFTLYGKTEIFARVESSTRSVTVHAVNLTITGHVRVVRNGINLYHSRNYNEKYQWFVILLREDLRAGDNIIIQFLHYKTPIRNTSHSGLYYYTRQSPSGQPQYGVVTQMQTTYARQAFPCFDEPALKATFEMTIYRQANFSALSNAPLRVTRNIAATKWIKDVFESTPRMSTYLVAVVVTQYKHIPHWIGNVKFRFYYPPGKTAEHLQVAVKVSNKIFPVIEEYFGVRYPMSKLDQIGFAIDDYSLGGMENFGLVTYKDTFLYQNLRQPKRDKYIAKLILHELTHQWFGNIVTMKWWDDLWLNEGVTDYFTMMRGKWLDFEYQLRALGQRYVLRGMSLEQMKIMLPVYVPWAKTPEEIESLMNDVTYVKGGMTIKMAELLMGENTFKKAMRDYIKKNLYGSVTHQDLWNEFSKANKANGINLNMSRILTPWIMQSGFPLVTVKINPETNTINYSQELFIHSIKDVNAKLPVPNAYNYTWPIPLQWKTKMGNSQIHVMFNKTGSVKVSHQLKRDDYVVVNPEANFYYIVNYEKDYWRILGKRLEQNYKIVDQYTRAKLTYDAMCLYAATRKRIGNYIDASTFNQIFRFAKYETEELPLVYLKEIYARRDPALKPINDILAQRFGRPKMSK